MVEKTAGAPKKRRSIWRKVAWVLGVLIVLLVGFYFVVTSAAFFKGVILPKVGKALNANVSVADVSINPFKEVMMRQLKVQTTGPEPLLTAQEVGARYSLWDIIRGTIKVEDVMLDSPTVQIIENPDGTSNLDPILQSQKKETEPAKAPGPSKPSKPLQIDVKDFLLKNA